MRMMILLLVVSTSFCFKKEPTYFAEFNLVSVSPFNPDDTLKIEDWAFVDTSNIYYNDRLVVVNTFESYCNDNLSYIILKFVKSNKGGSKLDNPDEHVLIDYKRNLIYMLNDEVVFPLFEHESVNFKSKPTDGKLITDLFYKTDVARLTFDQTISPCVRGKYISSTNLWGVNSIKSPYQKMDLINYRESNDYDLDSLLTIAQKSCKLSAKKIDLLFFQNNKQ